MKKLFILILLIVGVAAPSSAEIGDVKFDRLDTRDGLSNSQILCIRRDSKGFVWIGTPYGLNRYDGYRFKSFYSYPKDTTTLRSNYVDEIYEAYDGKIWLHQGMSYVVYDPVTEKFNRHPEAILRELGMDHGIERLFIDSHKHFWVKGTDAGVWHIDPYTKKVKEYRSGFGRQEFNSDIGVSSFAEFGKSVLVASYNGDIVCFNREKDWISWKDTYLHRKGFVSNQDCRLKLDRQGNIYAVTMQSTFIKMNGRGRWYHSLPELLRVWGFEDASNIQSVWDVTLDKKGRMWISTDHYGIFVIDKKTKEMRQFLNDKNDPTSICDNTIRMIYCDQLGRLWIGSYMNGLSTYAESSSNFRNIDLGIINTVCVDKAGYYWLGTNDKGFIRYDPRTTEQVIYDKANSPIGSNTMVSSLAGSDGSIWFGTYEGGLIRIKNGQVKNFRATGQPTDLANDNIWTIYEDQWGYIWLGTLGGGVQRINPKTEKFDIPINTHNSIIPSDYVSSITRTQKGWMMVGHSLYYSIINPKTRKVINRNIEDNKNGIAITGNSIACLQDSRGLAWQGSASGATIWDPKTNEVYLLDMRSGLMGSTVNGIIEDNRHSIWLITDHGVSNIVPQKEWDEKWNFVLRSFNNRDGLQNGPFNQRAICYAPDGKILVGGQGGLDIIDPQKMGKGRFKEIPLFSGLKVSGQEVVVGEKIDGRVILDEALDVCREFSLAFDDEFTVEMASNSGEAHNRSRFVYKMAGYNDVWRKTEEVNPNITYMSLRAGSYYLCVRMLNDDGTFGDNESRIAITIRPPLWRTRWMVLLYMLLIAVAAWIWHKWFIKRQENRMKVETTRRELEKQQWMNEMRMQLINEHGGGDGLYTVQHEQVPVSLHPSDLVTFVREFCENYESPVKDKRVKVTFVSPVNELHANIDTQQLSRVFEILFQNAATFSPENCQISVGVARTQNNEAQIQVADNGIGIHDQYKAHAFDPIVNGEGANLDKVKAVIDAHHGDIRIEDNPGGGTIFVITLPADEIVEEAVMMDDDDE